MTRKAKAKTSSSTLAWLEDTLRGHKTGLLAESLRKAARLGSLGYQMGVRGREVAYEKGLLQVKRLPRPTVCVGNITVGGTGKTPLVMRLAHDLLMKGKRPAILLRGYKREHPSDRPVIVRGPDAILANLPESGDEAMELARRLPGACVGVGGDRFATGSLLLKRFPIDCFIMDDGFQHYQLHRDINIVTLDVTDPWGGGKLLPAGLLRESPEALRRADYVILTRAGLVSPDRLAVLRAQVEELLSDKAAVLESRHEPRCLVSLHDQSTHGLTGLKGKSVAAISGIANPQSFEATLSGLGAHIAARYRCQDHGGKIDEVWTWISAHTRRGQSVIMTEKDAVRWWNPSVSREVLAKTQALRMELVVSSGQDLWKKMLKRLISA